MQRKKPNKTLEVLYKYLCFLLNQSLGIEDVSLHPFLSSESVIDKVTVGTADFSSDGLERCLAGRISE